MHRNTTIKYQAIPHREQAQSVVLVYVTEFSRTNTRLKRYSSVFTVTIYKIYCKYYILLGFMRRLSEFPQDSSLFLGLRTTTFLKLQY